jgi:hypothetical protein
VISRDSFNHFVRGNEQCLRYCEAERATRPCRRGARGSIRNYWTSGLHPQSAIPRTLLLSAVFLDVWRQAASFKGRASVSTWLLAIAPPEAALQEKRRGVRRAGRPPHCDFSPASVRFGSMLLPQPNSSQRRDDFIRVAAVRIVHSFSRKDRHLSIVSDSSTAAICRCMVAYAVRSESQFRRLASLISK